MASYEHAQSERAPDEITLLDVIRVIWKYRLVEVGIFVAACLIAAVYCLLAPKEYEATASVLPPADTGSGGALQTLVGQSGLGATLGGAVGSSSSTDIFVGMLKSRTMLDGVIKKFNLVKAYGFQESKTPMRSSRRTLARMTDVKVSKEGIVSVAAWAYEPKMAADMANFYVDSLDRLNTSINITDAGRTRLFLEGRVADAQDALREAEDRLKDFQSRSKAIVMEDQTKAAIEGAAMLEGQILAAEVQLKTLETYATARNPDVIKLRESIGEMRNQLRRMEYGKGAAGRRTATGERERGGSGGVVDGQGVPLQGGAAGDFSVALGSVPETGLKLVRLIRDAKMQETIFTLLSQQLEQAKITEAKDTPTVRILDRAVVPEAASRPMTYLIIAVAGFASIFIGVFMALTLDYVWRKGGERRGAQ